MAVTTENIMYPIYGHGYVGFEVVTEVVELRPSTGYMALYPRR
jgi:hypothetical protein